MPDRAYTDEELNAAIERLTDPEKLRAGQDLVMRATPALQRVLTEALADGGWFGSAQQQAVREAANASDPDARLTAVRSLLAEETRLGMLVGVAVGFELARTLEAGGDHAPAADPTQKD